MLCSEKTSRSIDQFLRLSVAQIILVACGLVLCLTMNNVFAAAKKHTVVAKTGTHATKKHGTAVKAKTKSKSAKTKKHHSSHKKHKKHAADQNTVATGISISYEGATLVANVDHETPIPTPSSSQKTLARLTTPENARRDTAKPNNPVVATAEPESKPEETGLFQTIANAVNFTPSKLNDTEEETTEVARQTLSVPTVKEAPALSYLAKPEEAEAPPTVEHTSFAASVEKHLVNFVHKTVATLRYSDYKLGGRKFDTSRGVYIVDCSSFVDHILQRVSPRAYLSLVSATGADTPATQHYYEFFTELTNGPDNFWNKVEAVEQLRAGDILVFRYKNSRGSETGGHVMVVMDKPVRDTDVFFVRVADSAPSRHSQDTRHRNEAGIGIGTLVLKVNPRTGRPAAYAWGLGGLWNKNVNFAMARPLDNTEFG